MRPAAKSAAMTSRRVLLVDDNLDSVESLAELLAMSGHDTRTAADGPSAVALAREFKPEVVVCDLGLPGMSGFEVVRELRKLPQGADMLIAALTGYGHAADRLKSAEAGFDLHLLKPVDPSVIESLIDGLG
jgi:CheY-like chemotaxis protein